MSAAEEWDLLASWYKFKDLTARERVITATLHVVPPIAFKQAGNFKLDRASPANANRAKRERLRLEPASCARDLIGEGNLALVEAFDAFPERHNTRFENYARTCVRNAICRHAVSLLSVVDKPWGQRVEQDVGIDDPMLPDMVGAEDGSRRATPTTLSKELPAQSNFTPMRNPEVQFNPEFHAWDLTELPWILQARLDGQKLKDIAAKLNCSIPTAHRRVCAAILEVRQCPNV